MAVTVNIPSEVSQSITDGVLTKAPSENAVFDALALKQDTLVSGTTIKTINGATLLGSGDIVVSSSNLGNSDLTSSANARVFNLNGNTSSNYLAFKNQAGSEVLRMNGDRCVWANGSGSIATNTTFGENALLNNTTGSLNSAFGYEALKANSTAGSNSAFGRFALTGTTGANNSAFGTNAMYSNAGGINNSVFGSNVMFNNSAGSYNSLFGMNSGYNGTGSRNSAIGYNSLYYLGSGGYNCAIGDYSLLDVSTGSYNIGIGAASGGGITTGSYNTIMGSVGGLAATTANNVIITDGQANQLIRKDANNNQILGAEVALLTTATTGFTYLPSCAGLPTGVPTAITGKIPVVIDSTNNKMYIYSGGAWVALN